MLIVQERQSLHLFATLPTTYPITVLLLCLALAALAAFYAAQHVQFISGRSDLIASEKRHAQLYKEYASEFMGLDRMLVVVEPTDEQQGKEFVTRLGNLLEHDKDHVKEIFYRLDTTSLEGKKLLYLPPEALRVLHRQLAGSRELIQNLTTEPGLNTLLHLINTQVSAGMTSHLVSGLLGLDSPGQPTSEQKPVMISFLQSLLQEMERALSSTDYRYHSPWADFFAGIGKPSDEGFLLSDNRHFFFLVVAPQKSATNEFDEAPESLAAIRQTVTELLPEFPGLKAGVTGTQALISDETIRTQADASTATVVSLTGVTLLYFLFFKRIRHPLMIVATLLVGLIWTMGFVALTVGHLTIITIFVAPMLLGLADDFGVHFLARYEEERTHGHDTLAALRSVFAHTAPGIIAGAVTTALAFAAIMLADFRGVQELGLIASAGILLSLLATLLLLPALIVLGEAYRPWKARPGKQTLLPRLFIGLGKVIGQARGFFLMLAGLGTLAGLAALPTVSFDYNLLNLHARGTESVEWEKRIIENSERSSRGAWATAPTLETAMSKAAAFAALPSVETVESVATLVPGGQEERLVLVRALQPVLGDFPAILSAPTAVSVPHLQNTLKSLTFKLSAGSNQSAPEERPAEKGLREVRKDLLAISERFQSQPEAETKTELERFQQLLFRDFQEKWSLLRNNVDPPGPITLTDIPARLRTRFVSADGKKFLLQIYAKKNVWERDAQEEFITQLRQVDPEVTGSPVIVFESARVMKEGYIEGGFYAFIVIVVVAFVSLRRVGDVVLAMVPLGLGMIWTAGLMWLFNLQFNLANLVAAPLIIGIGVENGLHLMHRYREERVGGPALVAGSTGQSVALFSITTMVGFGSLMVGKYYGIFSMGLLLTLAVGSVLVASLLVLPLLLDTFASKNPAAPSE
jgi:hopanoid biosynthesis associated RND transporter like protein HpnN